MKTTYQAARENGLLPPFALAVATWRSAPSVVESIRSIDPRGAAAIFVIAWLAGFSGSVAGLLVAVALFGGLYAARLAAIPEPQVVNVPPAMQTVPLAAQLATMFPGLALRKVELQQPTQPRNGQAAKATA